ncbi:hypothetical protein [Pelistega ratti]|uniref:hypothetical protein n=1 Tax=Pelistega ratti TaxID=2652177 RepID=UPI00135A0218|nr:hypothetical protein [Pelistega ratti]
MFKIIDSNFLSGSFGRAGGGTFRLPEAQIGKNRLDAEEFLSYDNCVEIRVLGEYAQTAKGPKSNKFLLGLLGVAAGPVGVAAGIGTGMVYDYFNPPRTQVVGYDVEFVVSFKDGSYFVATMEQEEYKRMVRCIQGSVTLQILGDYSVVKFVH